MAQALYVTLLKTPANHNCNCNTKILRNIAFISRNIVIETQSLLEKRNRTPSQKTFSTGCTTRRKPKKNNLILEKNPGRSAIVSNQRGNTHYFILFFFHSTAAEVTQFSPVIIKVSSDLVNARARTHLDIPTQISHFLGYFNPSTAARRIPNGPPRRWARPG